MGNVFRYKPLGNRAVVVEGISIPALGYETEGEVPALEKWLGVSITRELVGFVSMTSHSIAGSYHSTSTLAQLNNKISDATLDTSTATRPPSAHKTNHQNGGSDEISIAGLSGEAADPQPPKTHAANHADGQSDELEVEDLATSSTAAGAVFRAKGTGGVRVMQSAFQEPIEQFYNGYPGGIDWDADGMRYLVNDGGDPGAPWAGKNNQIVEFWGNVAHFTIPQEGYMCWDKNQNKYLVYNGAVWTDLDTDT